MKDYYNRYKTDYSWMMESKGWVRALQGIRESQLAIGNGFLGSRAILEETPFDSKPGTYIAGLYDRIGSQVEELVNLPNPFNFKIMMDGEKLGVISMDVEEHIRILNLRQGLLLRHTVFQDSDKRRYDYQSLRFLSMDTKNIGVMQIVFTPLDEEVTLAIETGIDTSVYNSGTLAEGRKKHFRIKEVGQFKNEGYLIVETFSKMHTVIYRSGFYYERNGKKSLAKDNIFEMKVNRKETIVFTKIFYVDSIQDIGNIDRMKRLSETRFRKAFNAGFNSLIRRHIRGWDRLWDVAEVSVWSVPGIEKNLRFNIYHMLISARNDEGLSSIGAKALTSEGYHGHIFWDTEIFLLPFYMYILPDVARNMLLYRYKRLDAARARAKEYGFKGSMFPWESAGSGRDETPERARDLDGKIIKIHTGEMEQHITADIAYAFYHYYNVTHDEEFFRDYGFEVLFETARFWANRVQYNKKKRGYEIRHVIGPDEFHEDVNNNAFTNMMAKWNLLTAHKLFHKMRQSYPDAFRRLIQKIGITADDANLWKKISSRISINMDDDQIIEQFDGYFKKRFIKIKNWDEDFMPIVTDKLTPRNYAKTQLVKQADVVMLLYLLSDVFSFRTKKKNYEYYVERTIHKSSLSLPTYAIMAIDMGDRSRAYRFFNTALDTDLSNVHSNTKEGIHSACIGGTWQIFVNGFGGVKIDKEILSVDPKLPNRWRKILFSLYWRGVLLRFEVANNKVKIQIASSGRRQKNIDIKVFGVGHKLSGRRTFYFKRKRTIEKPQAYYL